MSFIESLRRIPLRDLHLAGWIVLLVALACGPEEDRSALAGAGGETTTSVKTVAPDARHRAYDILKQKLRQEPHPADGGGRAWIVDPVARGPRLQLRAGSLKTFHVVYEAGPLGIADGGSVSLQISPFHGWSHPQAKDPEWLGFTVVRTDAKGVELETEHPGRARLAIRIRGRALQPGERVHMVYGAHGTRARVDTYAEVGERIWIAVDGDGDGVRALVADSPSIDVLANRARRLQISLPSTARPGARVRMTVALLDQAGNAGVPFVGEVVIKDKPGGLELPERIGFEADDAGRRQVEVLAVEEGVYRLHAFVPAKPGETTSGLTATSNPLEVRSDAQRILWGDLHGHSQLSDGTGQPRDYYLYARDVAGLDVAALTDHDHWGLRHLDERPDLWRQIRDAALEFHEPGRFVTLLGYEWTNWLQGHRHVLYFEDDGEVLSALDPRFETPTQLWEALAGRSVLTFAQHSAGGSRSTNWDFPPDPILEPLTEIVSGQGSSEAADTPLRIKRFVEGNAVRDMLERGFRLGFVGSGDDHAGHPGLTQISRHKPSGLAAIYSETLDRPSLLRAMQARRVYATNGPRIHLHTTLDGQPMGTILEPDEAVELHRLRVEVSAVAPVERIDLIRRGGEIETLPGEGRLDWVFERSVRRLQPGDYLYVRVVQEDEGAAWSSPFFCGHP